MKNSCNRFFLYGALPILSILMLVVGASTEAYAENTYDILHKANLVEDSWDRKAQGMTKIVSVGDGKRILIIENFVTNANHSLDVYLASGSDLEKRVQLGEINKDSKIQFYPIPKNVNFLEYDTILISENSHFITYGQAMILHLSMQ